MKWIRGILLICITSAQVYITVFFWKDLQKFIHYNPSTRSVLRIGDFETCDETKSFDKDSLQAFFQDNLNFISVQQLHMVSACLTQKKVFPEMSDKIDILLKHKRRLFQTTKLDPDKFN